MSEKINADLKSLKFVFERNKPYLPSLVAILVGMILFFQFVIPQFNALLVARKEGQETAIKLKALKENLDILTKTNEADLDSQLKILNSALPINKDFAGILNAVNYVAQKTGVGVGDFSLTIGSLSETKEESPFPAINFFVPVDADVRAVNSFIEVIGKIVPLSEVTHVRIGEKASIVDLSFYYKPLGSYSYNQDAHIDPLSQKGLLLINKLSGFENGK